MGFASVSNAGVWGAQPVLGLMGDYYTNPALIATAHTAEAHGDLLIDAPTSYVGDAYKLTILPSFRFSNSQGYSALDSDYEHLSISNEFDTPRDRIILTGVLSRDSSLYQNFLLNGSTGVLRDGLLADVNWDRQLTELLDFATDVNWSRVHYGQSSSIGTLTDYKYESLTPSLTWAQSERTKLTLGGGAAHYYSLDRTSQSNSTNLQFGFTRQLTELWTLSASVGYSRARNQQNFSEEMLEFTADGAALVTVPVAIKGTQSGSVYNISVGRQTARLTWTANAARALVPTGFAFLSRQDTYGITGTYHATERWTIGVEVHRLNYALPQGPSADQNIFNANLTVAWQWTEHWTATIAATRVMQNYAATRVGIASSGVSVELSRQFDWKSIKR